MKVIVRIEDRTFEVEIADLEARPIRATVDGETFEVWPTDAPTMTSPPPPNGKALLPPASQAVQPPISALPTAPTANTAPAANTANIIAAPIPGVIVAIHVKVGGAVTAGQEVCVLEAMKMKNVIRAPRDGQIGAILAGVGQQVRQRQPLMEYVGS
jgi:biotin carboxyl carrier protein